MSQSHEIRRYNDCIALEVENTAVEMPVKVKSELRRLKLNLVASRLPEIKR